MEDLIGTISDHTTRDQKKDHNSLERIYFHLANSKRSGLAESEYQFMKLQPGDLANANIKVSMNREQTFVCSAERSELGGHVKNALLLSTRGQQAASDDFVAQPHQPLTKVLWKPQGQQADNLQPGDSVWNLSPRKVFSDYSTEQ